MEEFIELCRNNDLNQCSLAELDNAVVEYMNSKFLDGVQSHVANTLLAAISFERPWLGRPRELALPRAKQALRVGSSWLKVRAACR